MDQNEYRAKKESGELVSDADLQKETPVVVETEAEEEEIKPEVIDEEPEKELEENPVIEDEEEPLPEEQKTAFAKRLEREQKKIREAAEKELKEKYESENSRYKSVVDMLGGDPDQVEQIIRDNQARSDAQKLAAKNGWDDEQTQWYIEDQKNKLEDRKNKQEIKELRVQIQINKLKDNPDYAGIASMEKEIMNKITLSNGALTVEEAYWAMGGSKKAEQIRLEAQMRETEKRKKTPRTVLTDSQTSTTGEKPLPPEIAQQAERMGISMEEARRLMNNEPAKNIDDWRAKRNK